MPLLSRSLRDGAEAATEARRLLRDNRHADDEQRDDHRVTGQAAYEARRAGEEAKRQAARDALHGAHLGREAQRWAQIAVLRDFRTEIASERQKLIAALYGAVEAGDLESAVSAQKRLAVLGPVDAIAVTRLSALGAEVRT